MKEPYTDHAKKDGSGHYIYILNVLVENEDGQRMKVTWVGKVIFDADGAVTDRQKITACHLFK